MGLIQNVRICKVLETTKKCFLVSSDFGKFTYTFFFLKQSIVVLNCCPVYMKHCHVDNKNEIVVYIYEILSHL